MSKKDKPISRPWHLKPRILMMLFVLMLLIFVSIFCAFNLFVRTYIRSNVEAQLDHMVLSAQQKNEEHEDRFFDEEFMSDLNRQHKNKLGALGQVIVLTANYAVQGTNGSNSQYDQDEILQIVSHLRQGNVPLTGARFIPITTEQGEYFISSTEIDGGPGGYFVFYVNVSGINHLVATINLAMAIILVAAMIICFFLANMIAKSVTSPLNVLSQFAEEIGKGNFQKQEFFFQDVEFFKLGEAMNRSAEKLDLYDKDQRTFFQNVSHELRTPLQSIRCYAEGIEVGLMEPKKSVAVIISETGRLSELVEDLLYVSRVDNITPSSEMCEGDVRETLARCAENLKSIADKSGLTFVFQFDDDPVLLRYNEKHLYRAFTNLLANALRYGKETITLRCVQGDDHIKIVVMDDGPGISSEDLPNVFDRFYRGRDGKHGIGLSIVKSVVELHGGAIQALCREGTQFIITFPRK